MKKRTRMLSLILAILMIVGIMPISVFAVESGTSGTSSQNFLESLTKVEGEAYDNGGIEKFFENVFGDFVCAGSLPEGKTWLTANGVSFTNALGNSVYYMIGNQNAQTVLADDGSLYFGAGGSNGDYIDLRQASNKTDTISNVANKNLGGRDFVITFKYKPENITNQHNVININTRPSIKNSSGDKDKYPYGLNVCPLVIKPSKELLFGNKVVWDFASNPDFAEISLLVDTGGATLDEAKQQNKVYLFINGDYIDSTTFLTDGTDGQLKDIYDDSAANYPSYAPGFCLTMVRINHDSPATTSLYADDFAVYYCDEVRSNRDSLYASFDTAASGQLTGGSAAVDYKVGESGLNPFNGATGYRIIDGGNGGKALQINNTENKEHYLNVNNKNMANKSTVTYGFDIKVGPTGIPFDDTKLFGMINRSGAKSTGFTLEVHARKSGQIGFRYYLPNSGSMETKWYDFYINPTTFTRLDLEIDNGQNKAWLYVNGVLVSDPAGVCCYSNTYFNDNQSALRHDEMRIFQDTSDRKDSFIFDNISSIGGKFTAINEKPLNGYVKDGGKYYYYKNGCLMPNSVSEDGVVQTDKYGVVIRRERTAFIDWANASKNDNFVAGANKSGIGEAFQEQYRSYFGADSWADLKVYSFWHRGDTVYLPILDSVKTNPVAADGTVIADKKFLDINDYDAVEMDVYSEKMVELFGMWQFIADTSYYTGTGGVYANANVNYGTDAQYGVKTAYKANGTSSSNPYSIWEVVPQSGVYGWTTMSRNISEFGKNRYGSSYVDKDTSKSKIDDNQLIKNFFINASGWNLDYEYTDASAKVLAVNDDTYTMFIKEVYLIKYVPVTDITALYTEANGDYVPSDIALFDGIFTSVNGNKYYYSAETHQRVVSKAAYEVVGADGQSGFSIDANGVMTPLNGQYKVQTLRTHYYINGVKQVGTAANDFKVTIGGKDYRITSDGDVSAWREVPEKAPYPTDYKAPTENVLVSLPFGDLSDQAAGGGGALYNTATANYDKFQFNGRKFAMSATVGHYNGVANDTAMKVTFHRGNVDSFFQYQNNYIYFTDTLLEMDIKISDDWNIMFSPYFQYRKDSGGLYANGSGNQNCAPFSIDSDGYLLDPYNRAVAKLSTTEYTKISFLLEHIDNSENKGNTNTNGNTYVNGTLYVNGVKVFYGKVSGGSAAMYRWHFLRFAVYQGANNNLQNGSLYIDNFYLTGINDTDGSQGPLEPGAKFTGIFGGQYFIDNVLQTGKKIDAPDGKFYLAEADGTLLHGSALDPIKYYNVEGKYYDLDGYAGELADRLEADGKYYIDGVLQTGLFTPKTDDAPNGEKWYTNENNVVIQSATKLTIGGKVVDIINYVVTVRDGLYIENAGEDNEYANIYVDGVLKTDVGFVTVGDKQYYIENDSGEIVKRNANALNLVADKWFEYGADGYECKLADGLYIENAGTDSEYANLYIDGVLWTTEGMKEYKGDYYFVESADGKLFKEGIKITEGTSCGFIDYVGVVLHESEYDGRYYRDGLVVKNEDIVSPQGYFYCADENGDLKANGLFVAHDGKWYMFGADCKGVIANGVMKDSVYSDRFYDNGVLAVNKDVVMEGYIYCADENGDLKANGLFVAHDGKWYMFGADCKGVIANGIMKDSVYADRYYIDGVLKIGFFTVSDKHYLTNGDGDLLTGKQVVAADGYRVYDFNATTYEGTMRDNYAVIENLYWLDGNTINGIHFIPVTGGTEEMYFIDGAPSAGEVPYSDGTVHVFGQDGKRLVEENADAPEDKVPLAIKITLRYKTADGFVKISDKFIYQFWNTDLKYFAPYNGCYAISIEVICGGETFTYDASSVIVENVQADCQIIVTYDKTVTAHNYVLVGTDAPTCSAEGTNHYVCSDCGATKDESIDIVPTAHDYVVEVTPATCYTNGKTVYTCSHCEDTYTVYSEKKPHTWVDDAENSVAPTCGESGKNAFKCSVSGCGATKEVTIAPTADHHWDITTSVDFKAATCATDGYKKYGCSGCSKKLTVVIPATGSHVHDPASEPCEVLIDLATGTEARLYSCAVCGEEGAIVVVVPPTVVAALPASNDEE